MLLHKRTRTVSAGSTNYQNLDASGRRDRGWGAFEEVLESIQPTIAGDPVIVEAIDRIAALHDRWTTEVAEREIALVRSGDLESARALVGTRWSERQ